MYIERICLDIKLGELKEVAFLIISMKYAFLLNTLQKFIVKYFSTIKILTVKIFSKFSKAKYF